MSRQLVQYHPVLGHLFVPGLKVRVPHETGGHLVQTNARGFRSRHEFAAARTPGLRRILLFGDSFTVGDGGVDAQRYSDVLETLLPATEVYYFGISGTGTGQHYLAWRKYARGVEADHVVIAVQPENIRRTASAFRLNMDPGGAQVYYPKPYCTRGPAGLGWHHQPVPEGTRTAEELPEGARADVGGRLRAIREAVSALGVKDLVQRVTGFQPLPEYDRADSQEWPLMREVLLTWIRGVSQPLTLFHVPLHQYVEGVADPSGVQARLRDVAAEAGAAWVDPLPEVPTQPLQHVGPQAPGRAA